MNILIVDDEKYIIDEIKYLLESFLDNSDIHIESTTISILALDMINNSDIDLLITDISMPAVSGIDLAETLRQKNKNSHIIFISAYDSKDYLKAAIKINVDSYIEKPINSDNFKKIAKEIYEDVNSKSNAAIDKISYMYALSRALLNPKKNTNDISLINSIGIKTPSFCLVGMKVTSYDETNNIFQKLINLFDSHFENTGYKYVMSENHDAHILIIYNDSISKYTVETTIKDIIRDSKNSFGFSVAISETTSAVSEIPSLYNDLITTLQFGFYQDHGIITSNRISEDKSNNFSELIPEYLTKYDELLIKADVDSIIQFYDQISEKILDLPIIPPSIVKYLFNQFLFKLYLFAQENTIVTTLTPETISNSDFGIFSEMSSTLLNHTKTIFEQYTRNSSTINEIKKYISNNYEDEYLSVKSISEALNLNNAYICSRFKKETGITISDFITRYRINKSKQLIIKTNLSIKEIAYSVGYKDHNYFCRVFKKYVGITAMEYKRDYYDTKF